MTAIFVKELLKGNLYLEENEFVFAFKVSRFSR